MVDLITADAVNVEAIGILHSSSIEEGRTGRLRRCRLHNEMNVACNRVESTEHAELADIVPSLQPIPEICNVGENLQPPPVIDGHPSTSNPTATTTIGISLVVAIVEK